MTIIETDRTKAAYCLQRVVRGLDVGSDDPSELRRNLADAQQSYTSLLEHSRSPCRPGVEQRLKQVGRLVKALDAEARADLALVEWLDEVDAAGRPTGRRAPRELVHLRGTRHAGVQVAVLDGRARAVLLQKRGDRSVLFPNRWTWSAAGQVPTGHGIVQAAYDEAREELFVPIPAPLREELRASLQDVRHGIEGVCLNVVDGQLRPLGRLSGYDGTLRQEECLYLTEDERNRLLAALPPDLAAQGITVEDNSYLSMLFLRTQRRHSYETLRQTVDGIAAGTGLRFDYCLDNWERQFFFSAVAHDEQLRALESLVKASEWWAREPDAPQLAQREAKDFRWKNVVELLQDVVHNPHHYTETFAALADDAQFQSDLEGV